MSPPRLDFPTVDASVSTINPADLAAEIERLRHDLADLREAHAQHRMDNEHAYDEGYDAGTRRGYESECAAVVAWLRAHANAPHPIERGVPSLSPAGRGLLLLHADMIERGEHRREEDK